MLEVQGLSYSYCPTLPLPKIRGPQYSSLNPMVLIMGIPKLPLILGKPKIVINDVQVVVLMSLSIPSLLTKV